MTASPTSSAAPAPLRVALSLARARTRALAGDLDGALDELTDGPDGPAILDLRARIHAQRGDLDQADACWAAVLREHPDDADALAGRETIAHAREGHRIRPLFTPARAAGVVAVLVAATIVGTSIAVARSDDDTAVATIARSRPDPAASEAGALRRRMATIDAQRTAAARRRQQALTTIAAAFTLPGVRVEQRPDDVRLIFTAGLFSSGTTLTPDATPLLTEVGRRLAPLHVSTTVVGHVVAVRGGRTSGGSTVAYGRAQVAAERLAAASGLPLTAFTLATADQTQGPYPDAPRNRTVTLELRPA